MNRRKLLKSVAGGVTLGLAGCIARQSSTDATNGNETTNNSEDKTDHENRTENEGSGTDTDSDGTQSGKQQSTLAKKSFNVVSSGCGKEKIETNASFEGRTVQVTGTISGSNSCYTAELKDVTLEQDTLTVRIRSFENKNNELCSMCLSNIEYNTTCTFEDELPNRVVVVHNGKEAMSKRRS
ncbi:hypothetical protein [Halocatena marina]|uniref:hypothetical protein n=1 Tax=Halocatena marina TaxID=2934937 RepID=UPI00200D6FAB|nr:hypothetical protein [Halocatena marina]